MMEKLADSKGRQHKHSTLPLLRSLLLVGGALFLSSSSLSSSISSSWLPVVGVNALTYDNDLVNDPNEVTTRHTRTKRKTRVASIDDLSLGDMEAEQAAQQVLEHIGVNVRKCFATLIAILFLKLFTILFIVIIIIIISLCLSLLTTTLQCTTVPYNTPLWIG